ncbi:MAG: GPW/gp25 family protein [Flavobacteriales bacterium]|nr:GPW/gp25 family protein [Flavobacteriales bacterium]
MEQGGGYGIPLDVGKFFQQRRFEMKPLHRSIAEHIHLFLITGREEFEFDREFGCEVWDNDFETQSAMIVWVDRIAESIRTRLCVYEKRLSEVEVTVDHTQAEFSTKEGEKVSSRLKRKLTIRLTARIASTNEAFRFEDTIFMSPFSLD